MWLSFSCILELSLFPPSLHNTCSCYYLHSQIDADKDSVFWLANLHPSWKKNRMHFYSIQIRSSFLIQVSCMVYTIKNLNSRNLNGDLDAKLVSCIPGFISHIIECKKNTNYINENQVLGLQTTGTQNVAGFNRLMNVYNSGQYGWSIVVAILVLCWRYFVSTC